MYTSVQSIGFLNHKFKGKNKILRFSLFKELKYTLKR